MLKHIFALSTLFISIFASDMLSTEFFEKTEESASIKKWRDSNFGLQPHHVNYILPYGRREGNYISYDIPAEKYINVEAELQVSLKMNVLNNLFNFHEKYYLSYSHKAFWQIYVDSAPFRETNYNPEAFVVFPIADSSSIFQRRSLTLAYSHLSNGQGNTENAIYPAGVVNPGSKSRSINSLFAKIGMQHGNLFTDFTLWTPFAGNDLSDNPDLMDYMGYGELKFNYFLGENMFTLSGRYNIATGNGAVEATYSHPLIDDVYLYAKIYSGYGESLIDYNNYITKFSIGFSFSR